MSYWYPWRHIGPEHRRGGIVLVADHASNYVPEDIELGIEPALMHEHIALDIGVEGVAERLARDSGIPRPSCHGQPSCL